MVCTVRRIRNSRLLSSSGRRRRRFSSRQRPIMSPSTWLIMYWFTRVQRPDRRRASLRMRDRKRAAEGFLPCSGAAENSSFRSRS